MKKLAIPENLTSMAYKSIKQYILEGQMKGDSRLTEEFLSNQLGISKSPIREALNRLETEGLIRIEPRRGAYLRRYSSKEADDLYDLREALEVHVVRTARITPDLLGELKKSIANQRGHLAAQDQIQYIQEDVSFHAKLANATGNETLRTELERLQNIIWVVRRNNYDLLSSAAPDGHEAVLAALERGDRAAAQDAMRAHISRVRSTMLERLAAEEGLGVEKGREARAV